jgi:SAM-dependent methyltransferase
MTETGETRDTGSFKDYSYYYDEIYSDKDYEFETDWIYDQILHHAPTSHTRKHLDLGAGTGKHAFRLAKKGVRVTAVELSSQMVSLAPKHENLYMVQGDLVEFKSDEKFGSCSAMFHVLSYMTSLDEMVAAVKNAAANLEPDGIFIFDVWHSPAVEHLGVELRVKRISRPNLEIIRLAEPSESAATKTVSVRYTLFVAEHEGGDYRQVTETHILRHFGPLEVKSALSEAGLTLLDCFESYTGRTLTEATWSACYVSAKGKT